MNHRNSSQACVLDESGRDDGTLDRQDQFFEDVCKGLSSKNRFIDCKYLYDERGSALFDKICELDEYYPTRTELAIMEASVVEMAQCIGSDAVVVELGSGSSTKTRVLLDHLKCLKSYLPVDISHDHLHRIADRLNSDYPDLIVDPVVADFTGSFQLPRQYSDSNLTVYFPGSTIGNLRPHEAKQLLHNIAELQDGPVGLLIGFDLVKDQGVLERAYNDSKGVSAQFSLNVLHRVNRELEGDIEVDYFEHVAFYNQENSRIEIYIESRRNQKVRILDREFEFSKGERIHVEYSHKYTIERFSRLANSAGLTTVASWTDPDQYFAVMYFTTT